MYTSDVRTSFLNMTRSRRAVLSRQAVDKVKMSKNGAGVQVDVGIR